MTGTSDSFDYVIIGGGTAGCVLAARLSEDASNTVCLLEAGPADRHPFIHLPGGFIRIIDRTRYTWQFASAPGDGLDGRIINFVQGRTLGGSSAINAMIVNRGQREDYDRWQRGGADGWSYADVLPYFKRLETAHGFGSAYRGTAGELHVTRTDRRDAICDAFIAGAQVFGMPANADYNGADQAGVGYTQQAVSRALRMSSARAFLAGVKHRPNLAVRVEATVMRLLFDGRRAIGVRVRYPDGAVRTVMARSEVILCAGALNTPRLLQVSGIGPADLIRSLGVEPVQALDGVGANLSDHYMTRVVARGRGFVSVNQLGRAPRLWLQAARWFAGRSSILGNAPVPVHFFWKSSPVANAIDLQGTFTPGSYKVGAKRELDDFAGMTCAVWQHRPRSVGFVRAVSADVAQPPLVQPNYMADPLDRAVTISGLRMARALLRSEPLAAFYDREELPGTDIESDDALLDYAKRSGSTAFHFCGTAKIGAAADRAAVIDPQLRVHGVGGLRVADASVMPDIVAANTCVPTMMIAEKAADLISGKPALAPLPDL